MKTASKCTFLASFLLAFSGCDSGSGSTSSAKFKSASDSVKEITLPDENCTAWNINDNGEILYNCFSPSDESLTNTYHILYPDGQSREIYRDSGVIGRSLLNFANDGSALLVTFGSNAQDQPTESSWVIGKGDPIAIPLEPGQFATAQSPNGEFISTNQPLGNSVTYLKDLVRLSVATAPDGVAVYEPFSINNKGDAVGLAIIGSEGTGFQTSAGYRVLGGKFELLSFGSRPELSETVATSINSEGDVLLDVDTGQVATLDLDGSVPTVESDGGVVTNLAEYSISSPTILTASGDLIKLSVPDPAMPVYGVKINNSRKVLAAMLTSVFGDTIYFITGIDQEAVLVSSLINLKPNEYIFSVILNNNDELLVTTAVRFPETTVMEASDANNQILPSPRVLVVKLP